MEDSQTLTEYIQWLVDIYAQQTGVAAATDLIRDAITVLRKHSRRWPGEEDFVSLVAAEFAGRLHERNAADLPPFLKLLDQSADAVRHRIARAARKEASVGEDLFNDVAVQQGEAYALAVTNEIAASLTLEEQAILELLLSGRPAEDAAKELNISRRTIYRRIGEIKNRLKAIL